MAKTTDKPNEYIMKIERTVIDKLGLKMYDKVSAVVAELVANSYDADAENVVVKIPLGKALATKKDGGIKERDYVIEIVDDGFGMTPSEANDFYLRVGKDRRIDARLGDKSREKKRPVMGRKGIGKLAPFGVCRKIEVRSAGGEKKPNGYQVTHFELDYDEIMRQTSDEDRNYKPIALSDDGTWDKDRGTLIRLKDFLPRIVPDKETFNRQLSYRFLPLPDFKIMIQDIKENDPEPKFIIGETDIPLMGGTKVVVDDRPVVTEQGVNLPVTGWVAMARGSYKNIEFAGVRIYARGKIAAITRDFGVPSGFQGEYVARSYLVGEIRADWLDEEEDFIQTHRQDILWSTEKGEALAKWGQAIVKEVAKRGREPRREMVRDIFFRVSKLREVSHDRFRDEELERTAAELGGQIGGFASEEELDDQDYVSALRELILTVTPHKLLVDAFRQIEKKSVDGKINLQELVKIFRTSRIAQLASYGQIVDEKIKAIDAFQRAIREGGTEEKELQKILENAPWLIEPRWEVVTANRTFKNFVDAFKSWYKKNKGSETSVSSIENLQRKRPDFILLHQQNSIIILEIKPPKHTFNDDDFKRLNNYDDAMTEFLDSNPTYAGEFPKGHHIFLVADEIDLRDSIKKKAFDNLVKNRKVLTVKKWEELLHETKLHYQDFMDARDATLKEAGRSKSSKKPKR